MPREREMYTGTYNRLRLPVWASNRAVIRAGLGKLKPVSRRGRAHRETRHAYLRELLVVHHAARSLARTFRL